MDKRHKGRGFVNTLVAQGQEAKLDVRKTEEHIRNYSMYRANEALKNARTCEQIAHRIRMLDKATQLKGEMLAAINQHRVSTIRPFIKV